MSELSEFSFLPIISLSKEKGLLTHGLQEGREEDTQSLGFIFKRRPISLHLMNNGLGWHPYTDGSMQSA